MAASAKRGKHAIESHPVTRWAGTRGVPVRFLQPFAGIGYGMGVGIVLGPARASFTGCTIGAGSYCSGGVRAGLR